MVGLESVKPANWMERSGTGVFYTKGRDGARDARADYERFHSGIFPHSGQRSGVARRSYRQIGHNDPESRRRAMDLLKIRSKMQAGKTSNEIASQEIATEYSE
jgi:hypothetical protein